jgi:hypothetical protein
MGTHDDFQASEAELAEHFTDSLGVAAQVYDREGGASIFDSDKAVARLAVDKGHRGHVQRHQAVQATLATLLTSDVHVLRLAYGSRQLGDGRYRGYLAVDETVDRTPKGAKERVTEVVHNVHRAALAQLLPHTPAARQARVAYATKCHFASPGGWDDLIRWLDESARGPQGSSTMDPLVAAAEVMLDGPLSAYEAARRARVAAAVASVRENRRAKEKDRQDLLDGLLGGLHVKLWGQP